MPKAQVKQEKTPSEILRNSRVITASVKRAVREELDRNKLLDKPRVKSARLKKPASSRR